MVEITNCKEPCFAKLEAGCKVITGDCVGKDNCVFYKPTDCKDWIRKEKKGEVWLMPPEEYYDENALRLLRR